MYFIIMNIKSSKDLVEEANKTIKIMSPEEVKDSYDKGEITLIDVRDIRELWREGTIKNSIHIPRGMLEFWLDPNSSLLSRKKNRRSKKFSFILCTWI